ncbi:MAG: glycosyltransferase family 4 protein [Marinagarivorans sp.]|nr:glycosyltransferase family 4 protein [Marinagarivorans sp.]
MTSGIFVGRLYDALTPYLSVCVVAPDSNEDISVRSGVVAFRYALKRHQRLAHLPGGIPVQLKKNPILYFYVPLFLASYLYTTFCESKGKDIILANWAVSGLIGAIVKIVTRKALITVLRGDDVKFNGKKGFLLSIAIKHSDSVVVVSEEMCNYLKKMYPSSKNKMITILNGVDKSFSSIAGRKKFLSFIFVGSLIKRKNIDYIINEMATWKNLDFEFHIIGDGDMRIQLQNRVKELELSKQIQFYGEISPEKINKFFSGATFYISASLHEGRPNAVVEAIAAGCIPILSNISGHRELIGNLSSQLLFSQESQGSLSHCVESLLIDKNNIDEIKEKITTLKNTQLYSWDKCATHYVELINNVCEKVK